MALLASAVRPEMRQLLGRYGDLCARPRISPFIGTVALRKEASEASYLDPAAALEHLGHVLNNGIEYLLGLRRL